MSEIIDFAKIVPSDFKEYRPTHKWQSEVFGSLIEIPLAHLIPVEDKKIGTLPDSRAYRVLSRSGILFNHVLLKIGSSLRNKIQADPFRVGIYGALAQLPVHYPSSQKLVRAAESASSILRRHLPPKQIFLSAPHTAVTQAGRFLEIMGPTMTYSHSVFGSIHALSQAEFDLNHQVIDLAFVGAAFSLEDPLGNLKFIQGSSSKRAPAEGAAGLALARSSKKTDWASLSNCREAVDLDFEIADPLVRLALRLDREGKHGHGEE